MGSPMASTSIRKVAFIAAALTVLGGTMAISAPRTAFVAAGLDTLLVRVLESRFAPAFVDDWKDVTGLIVLGGTTTRAEEAVRLAQRYPHLRIVLSGPGDPEVAGVRRRRLCQRAAAHRPAAAEYLRERAHVEGDRVAAAWRALASRDVGPPTCRARWAPSARSISRRRLAGG